MSEDFLEDPFEEGSDSLNVDVIFNKLLTSDDIALKTELYNPLALAQLRMLGNYFKSIGFEKCASTIEGFITAYCEFMVSYKRQGRTEIVKGISGAISGAMEERNGPLQVAKKA